MMKVIDITDIEDFVPLDLIDEVAKAIINADIDNIGGIFPWPEDDSPASVKYRQDARMAARTAISAFLNWGGHEKLEIPRYSAH